MPEKAISGRTSQSGTPCSRCAVSSSVEVSIVSAASIFSLTAPSFGANWRTAILILVNDSQLIGLAILNSQLAQLRLNVFRTCCPYYCVVMGRSLTLPIRKLGPSLVDFNFSDVTKFTKLPRLDSVFYLSIHNAETENAESMN